MTAAEHSNSHSSRIRLLQQWAPRMKDLLDYARPATTVFLRTSTRNARNVLYFFEKAAGDRVDL